MSYTHYTHTKWYEDSYENNVQWVKSQYEEYGDRIVFADISPKSDVGYVSSVIVKNQTETEPQTQQS
jgi:uncharacterized protein YgiM (DUF1202 family)